MKALSREIVVKQGAEEWFELRLGRATASCFSTIMSKGRGGAESAGRVKYRTELALERITGKQTSSYKSPAMQNGNDTEPLARLRYLLTTGNQAEVSGFFAHTELMTGASPDGLVGTNGQIEIKCPEPLAHTETLRKQELPSQYYWQVMGQLWITGRDWCDFISFNPDFPDNAALFVKRITRDDAAIAELETSVKAFLLTVDSEVAFIKNYKG